MLFKNPLLLYGLLLLAIPIIIHLFQLRRFKKVPFSNVAFLKPLLSQTRQSRTLKKWIVLITRLLAIACIVLAFAQPYLPQNKSISTNNDLVIYLDNSYSMQSPGADGTLYQSAINDLISKMPAESKFTLFTNDQLYGNVNKQEIANKLATADYAATALDPDEVILKANTLKNKLSRSNFLWISDFQKHNKRKFPVLDSLWNVTFVKLNPLDYDNISIDSAFFSQENTASYIQVALSSKKNNDTPVSLSLYNQDVLIAKTSVNFQEKKAYAQFLWPDSEILNAVLKIEDDGLSFDNQLFVSRKERDLINVLHVNNTENDFLNRIYTPDEFNYREVSLDNFNYNSITSQSVIILNGLSNIPPPLAKELQIFTENGNTLILIPDVNNADYRSLSITMQQKSVYDKKITEINFDHPLLAGVFSERVKNFQYPTVSNSWELVDQGDAILTYEDGKPFLTQKNDYFIFTASLDADNSNFQASPLVVPVFYQLGLRNTKSSELYALLGKRNKIIVKEQLEADGILELQLEVSRFIPEQRAYDKYVALMTGTELTTPGNYEVLSKGNPLQTLAFNASREENHLDYFDDDQLPGEILNDIGTFVQILQEGRNKLPLWKFLAAGALFFLICELLALKLLK